MTRQRTPSYLNFDKHSYPWKPDIDYRQEPEKYRVGKGEQGVLICEPYKSELTPHWRFKTPELASREQRGSLPNVRRISESRGFRRRRYGPKIPADGLHPRRRYANYKGGIKYDKNNGYALNERGTGDPAKAESAAIFHQKWKQAEAHPEYATRKKAWREQYG